MDKIPFEMTVDELNVIMVGLSKLPIEYGLSTFMSMKQQADKKLKSNEVPPTPSGVTSADLLAAGKSISDTL